MPRMCPLRTLAACSIVTLRPTSDSGGWPKTPCTAWLACRIVLLRSRISTASLEVSNSCR